MNMKVSSRIFAGFAVLIVVILINSIFTWSNLASIKRGTDSTTNIALPTLAHSNALKQSFVAMSKTVLLQYHSHSNSDINQLNSAISTQKQQFETDLKSLERIVSDQAELSSLAKRVSQNYRLFDDETGTLLNHLQKRIQFKTQVGDLLFEIEDNIDTVSSYILDISDYDDLDDNQTLQSLEQQGSELEDGLISLYGAAEQYSETDTLQRAETMASELTIFQKAVSNDFQSMIGLSNTLDSDHEARDAISDIDELLQTIVELINGANGLSYAHTQHLQNKLDASSSLMRADNLVSQGADELNQLLQLATQSTQKATSNVSESVDSGKTSTVAIVIISTLIGAIVAFFSAKAISAPLHKINEILQTVSSGDLTQRVEQNSNNEFGVLAKNCNQLIDNLTSLISSISNRSQQLATAAEQTSTVTEQTTHAISEQKSQIAQIATATTELSSTSEHMFHNSAQSLSQIENTNIETKRVRDISTENKNTIVALASEVEQAANVINKLHKDSNDIGGILDVIRGIAEQTNLLALNAAIEAARAGEQGRGFAVVADEVRTLASRTQESTQEIQNMIELLQSGARQAVAVMEQGQQQTQACVEQSERAATALDAIGSSIASASEVSQQIEESAKEQSTVSQQVSAKLESIVAIAEQTSAGAEQTSESSTAVAKLAEELQQSIAQFKV